jgi:LPXTG-motif cell wall-anchored protein
MRVCYESRMALRSHIAAACAVLVLAAPAVSLADSPGDQQYQDPFSNVPSQQKKPKKPTSSGTQGTQTQGTAAPAPATSTPTATTATPPPSGTSSGELPRTGFPVLQVAGVGVLLVGAGVLLLRRRTA